MDELKKQSKLSSYFTEVRRVESTRDMDFSHTDPFLEEKATQQFGLPKVEESPAKVRSKTSSHQNSKNNAMTFMQKLTLCRLDAMWTRRHGPLRSMGAENRPSVMCWTVARNFSTNLSSKATQTNTAFGRQRPMA